MTGLPLSGSPLRVRGLNPTEVRLGWAPVPPSKFHSGPVAQINTLEESVITRSPARKATAWLEVGGDAEQV